MNVCDKQEKPKEKSRSMEGQTSFSGAHNGRISGLLRIYMDGLLMVLLLFYSSLCGRRTHSFSSSLC